MASTRVRDPVRIARENVTWTSAGSGNVNFDVETAQIDQPPAAQHAGSPFPRPTAGPWHIRSGEPVRVKTHRKEVRILFEEHHDTFGRGRDWRGPDSC